MLRAVLFAVLCLCLLPVTSQQTAAQAASRTMNGYTVSGRFLEEWSKQGSDRDGIYVNGLPITERRQEISLIDGETYEVQWFERARYEAHPENPAPYDVLLGLPGVALAEVSRCTSARSSRSTRPTWSTGTCRAGRYMQPTRRPRSTSSSE